MKILKRLGLGLLGIIALLLIIAAFMSKDFRIEREVAVNKPKQQVFDYVRMLKNQDYYSVWNMKDPNSKKAYRGTDGTPGFVMAWDGNSDVGKGEQEIKRIAEGERVDMELRFERPFKNTANAYLTTEATGDAQTKVRWAFEGRSPWPFNLMSAMMTSKMGDDLQAGLNNLKRNVEGN